MGTILARDLTVGTIVYLKESGVNVPYIVADTANGTVLVRQDIWKLSKMYDYDSAYGTYAPLNFNETTVYSDLVGTFYPSLGENEKNAVSNITIPSKAEMDGGLAYFNSAEKRIAYYNGAATAYWTLTFSNWVDDTEGITYYFLYIVSANGVTSSTNSPIYSRGIRPKLTLLPHAMIDDGTMEVLGIDENGLPSGYTKQKGLISAGTGQYIKTALKPFGKSGFELKFRLNTLGKIQYLFGTSYPTSTCIYAYVNADNKLYVQYGSTGVAATYSTALKVGEEYTLRLENGQWTINGTKIVGGSSNFAEQSYVVYVFAVNNQNKVAGYGDITVLSFKAFSAGITNYYVPAEGPDGLGLYDLVGGGMLYNAGTGSFTVPKEPRVSKVELESGEVLIDLTATSVAEDTLIEGATAVDRTGNLIVGIARAGSATPMATGVYVPASDVTSFSISGLDFQPSNVAIIAETHNVYTVLSMYRSAEGKMSTIWRTNSTTAAINTTTQYITFNSNGFTAKSPNAATYFRSGNGFQYRWFAMG